MKVQSSSYLTRLRPVLCELLGRLQERYAYASVLATDVETKSYSVSRSGIRVAEIGFFNERSVERFESGEGCRRSVGYHDSRGIDGASVRSGILRDVSNAA